MHAYNIHDIAFDIGSMDSTTVIVYSTVRAHWQAILGRQQRLTVVEFICAEGTAVCPLDSKDHSHLTAKLLVLL